MRLFLLLPAMLFAWGCEKDPLRFSVWTVQNPPLSVEMNSIHFLDSLRGYAAGGGAYRNGALFSTTDGGVTWRLDTLIEVHKIEHVTADVTGRAYAVGQFGWCFERAPDADRWTPYRTDYDWHRGAHVVNGQTAVIVSGESFTGGVVRSFGPEYYFTLDTQQVFPNQLNAVWGIDTAQWIACGVGWVVRSDNGGRNWQRLPATDDAYTAIHFPTPQIGYICGRTGYILKSTDGGRHWETIRKGGATGARRQVFRSIWFSTASKGWVVGESGVLWKTEDGGGHWQTVAEAPDGEHFTDIFTIGTRGWVTAESGKVYYFEE